MATGSPDAVLAAPDTPVPMHGPMTQRRVLALAVPIIGETFLQTLVGVADTLMVARIGKEAIAGVGIAVEFVYFIIAILMALEIGATVLVSQDYGAGRLDRVNFIARQSISWGILLAVPLSVLGYFGAPLVISLFGAEDAVAANATDYLQITAATSTAILVTFVTSSVFRGTGDSRTPLFASVVANVVNIGASYVLIFGHLGLPELGVAGAAWGSAIGRSISGLIMLTLLFRGHRSLSIRGRTGWMPELTTGRDLFRLGLPASIEQVVASAGFLTLIAVVALLGTESLAAQQIAFTALALAFMPGFGFGMATTALVGQSVGARDLASADVAATIASRWAVVWMGTGGVLYFVLARPVMEFFSTDPEVTAAGVNALRALAIGLPLWAIWSVYGGALRGSGDTRSPMISNVTSTWTAVALAYLAVTLLGGGLGAVWLAFFLPTPVAAWFNRWRFSRRLRTGDIAPAASLPRG